MLESSAAKAASPAADLKPKDVRSSAALKVRAGRVMTDPRPVRKRNISWIPALSGVKAPQSCSR